MKNSMRKLCIRIKNFTSSKLSEPLTSDNYEWNFPDLEAKTDPSSSQFILAHVALRHMPPLEEAIVSMHESQTLFCC